ncbi:DUF5954 family protein [Streptomyces sp. MBT42]|uniref:DUF5954 family protein n=1 Tax=Streptomyces sp. MBT42 TaxID=1488373 RepID=UPI001E2EB2C9|nr:DUF5954 family protein [Streptomyces sp. MBT42]MCD2469530.1 DUF5954 family protein [Streptomyces sp. MBT42]
MSEEDAGPVEWPVVVRVPVEPVEAAMEADAADAAASHSALAVRGPLFGVTMQDRDHEGERRWRVIVEVTHGCPQHARDALNSLFWFRAKDEAKSRQERRALLAAVARLETEHVDELTVLGTRYRVPGRQCQSGEPLQAPDPAIHNGTERITKAALDAVQLDHLAEQHRRPTRSRYPLPTDQAKQL